MHETRPTRFRPTASTAAPAQTPPLHALQQLTRRVEAKTMDLSGAQNLRVLSESEFIEVLTRLVEQEVRRRLEALPPPPPVNQVAVDAAAGLAALNEEYRLRWQVFRSRFEERLGRLEDLLVQLATGKQPRVR